MSTDATSHDGDDIRPRPDPTKLTTDAVNLAVERSREYTDLKVDVIEQRLSDMDRATAVLDETVHRTPTEIQREVGHLREVMNEKFGTVGVRFDDAKEAVTAAFAAEQELATQRADANQTALDKQERTTAATIAQLSEKIEDLKERMGRFESLVTARAEARSAQEAQLINMRQALEELTTRVSKIA